MIHRFVLIGLILSLTSCLPSSSGERNAREESSDTQPLFTQNNITGTNLNNTTDTTSNNYLYIPTGATDCTWSSDGVNGFTREHAHLDPQETDFTNGKFNLCRSSTDQNTIYMQVRAPIDSHQLCFIPTTNEGTNKKYIGEPRCETFIESKKIYSIKLYVNRPGYTDKTITGVMIMRDKAYEYETPFNQVILSPDAFIHCSQWLAQHGDASYCDSFKKAAHYLYVDLPSS